jgi:CTP synthase (UTP-ammonia lyase)
MTRIALIGDFDEQKTAHRAIPLALAAAAEQARAPVAWEWLHTATLGRNVAARLASFDAVWCVPGSPYADGNAAIDAIRFARESARPFLGTCGGFQHALLEYAESIWSVDAANAETNPDATDPVITPLECARIDVAAEIYFEPGSRLARIYGTASTREEYRCRYGLSPRYAQRLASGALRVAARDSAGGVVGIEHAEHPFFFGALFQPERVALVGRAPPLIAAFVSAAVESRQRGTATTRADFR